MSKQHHHVLTQIRISTDTYRKLHFLKLPFETHDETLGRVLEEYRDMSRKIAILEEALVSKNGKA